MTLHQILAMVSPGQAAVATGILGLFLGSFYNVCIDRYLSGESILWPPSHCAHCQAKLRPWELIPVLSWIFLRARCAHCGAGISAAYPAAELISAVTAALVGWHCGLSVRTLALLVVTGYFIILSGIDLRSKLLPDRYTLSGAVISFPIAVWAIGLNWLDSMLGAAVGAGLFWILMVWYKKRRGLDGLGFGDVKLMLMIGFVCGAVKLPLVLILSGIAALVAFAGVALAKGSDEKISRLALPFGPFLALGAWVTVLWGDALWQWWFGFVTGR